MSNTSPRPRVRGFAEDLGVAAVAGYLATKVMEPVSQKLYELESERDRAQEDAARPGPPDRIAAAKITPLVGLQLSEEQLDRAAPVFHYGLAISWAPLYAVLRRATRLRPVAAGLATGSAMSLLVDELMTPPSASPRRTGTTHWSPTCAGSPRTWSSGWPSPGSPRPRGRCAGDALIRTIRPGFRNTQSQI